MLLINYITRFFKLLGGLEKKVYQWSSMYPHTSSTQLMDWGEDIAGRLNDSLERLFSLLTATIMMESFSCRNIFYPPAQSDINLIIAVFFTW